MTTKGKFNLKVAIGSIVVYCGNIGKTRVRFREKNLTRETLYFFTYNLQTSVDVLMIESNFINFLFPRLRLHLRILTKKTQAIAIVIVVALTFNK